MKLISTTIALLGLVCLTSLVSSEDVVADLNEPTTTSATDLITTTLANNVTSMTNQNDASEREMRKIEPKTDKPEMTTKGPVEGEDKKKESMEDDKKQENATSKPEEMNTTTAPEESEADKEEESKPAESTEPEAESGDSGDDPWGDSEDDNSGNVNIVDQMRDLREKDEFAPIVRNVSHLNATFDKVNAAWDVIDQYYLPSRQTWEKLLGLVTGLNVDVSPECFSSYFSGVSGFRSYQAWAYRYLDVRGRFPESGSLSGRLSSFGEWDECMELDSPQSSSTGLIVKGQYCLMEVKVPFPMDSESDLAQLADENHPVYQFIRKYLRTFKLHNLNTPAKMVEALQIANGTIFRAGLCIPQMCKAHEIETVITNLTYPIFKMPIQLGPKCYKKDQRMSFEQNQIVAMSVLTLLGTFVIFCTVVEWYNDSFDKRTAKDNRKLGALMFQRDVAYKPNPFLYSFSAVTNTRALLKKQTHFAALDTIKFLLVIYIHLYHYYNYLSTVGLVTLKRIFTTYPVTSLKDDRYTWFRLTLPFDAIFVISGMIIAFSMQRKLKNPSSKFNYLGYAFKLWIKFAITYAGSILFIYVLPTMATGPIWDHGMAWLSGCLDIKTVLFGFLFVSNYNVQIGVNAKTPSVLPYCNPPTWFMSALLQLLLIAPLIVYIGYKLSKRSKQIFFFSLAVFATVLTIMPYLAFGIKPEVHFLEFETLRETFVSYAWYRLGTNTFLVSFVLGIIGGYMLADFKVLLRQELENVILVMSFVLVQVAIALNNSFWRLDQPPKLLNSLLWYSVVRFLGSLGLTYIFYTIASNRANMVQRFLEWHPFQAVSRLAYSYFMVHIMVVFYRIFSIREVYAMTNSLMLQNFVLDFLLTLVVAYLFYCMVECPIVNLLNLWQGKIFYDIQHYKPKQGELRVQADINGNGHVSGKVNPEFVEDDNILAYPPNIVVEEFNSVKVEVIQPNEFEMNSPGSSGSGNNGNTEPSTDQSASQSETIATSRL